MGCGTQWLLAPHTTPGLSGLQGPPDEEAEELLLADEAELLDALLDEAEELLADEAELLADEAELLADEAELLADEAEELLADEAEELLLEEELPGVQAPLSQVKPSGHSCPQPPQ